MAVPPMAPVNFPQQPLMVNPPVVMPSVTQQLKTNENIVDDKILWCVFSQGVAGGVMQQQPPPQQNPLPRLRVRVGKNHPF